MQVLYSRIINYVHHLAHTELPYTCQFIYNCPLALSTYAKSLVYYNVNHIM